MADMESKSQEELKHDFDLKHYSFREIVRRILPLAKPSKRAILTATLLVMIASATYSLFPLFGKYVIDDAIPHRNFMFALWIIVASILIKAIHSLSWYLAMKIVFPVREQITFAMRSQGFRHLQSLCMRFHSKYSSGFLHDRIFEQSISRVGGLVTYAITELAANLLCIVFALILCLSISWVMTIVVIIGMACHLLTTRLLGPHIKKRTVEYTNAHNWISSYILDRLRGIKTIQAHAMEDRTATDLEQSLWPVQLKCAEMYQQQQLLSITTNTVGHLIEAAVYIAGAYAIINSHMTIGTLVAFIGYEAQLNWRATMFVNMFSELISARVGLDQYFTIIDTPSSIRDDPHTVLPARVRGEIEFSDVSFAYADSPTLQHVSFKASSGQVVALVGRSGAGKTTIANLLMRFYDPNNGRILLDGTPITDFPLREYRMQYGIVLQDPFLFDDTIEANLRCMKPDATEGELLRAIRLASASEFVEGFPDGLHHRVGEAGAKLSGGQKQRIAIARCLLFQPAMLVLDEATSALDSETEAAVQSALTHLFQGRTSFIIAHRLSTIRKADRILVMDQGRLVEDGTFTELIALQGHFSRLYHIATSTSTLHIKLDEAGFA